MGLSLEVGILATLRHEDLESYGFYLAQFEFVNAVLAREGLPRHDEPNELDLETWSADMYGYSGMHYLRRIAAHLWRDARLPPPGDEDSDSDPCSKAYYDDADDPEAPARPFDHLMLHSDAEGFYLPHPFDAPIVTVEDDEVMGTIIGSAAKLREECRRIAVELELPLDLDIESDEVWEAPDHQGRAHKVRWKQYGVESFTCLRLYRACERSLALRAALVFV